MYYYVISSNSKREMRIWMHYSKKNHSPPATYLNNKLVANFVFTTLLCFKIITKNNAIFHNLQHLHNIRISVKVYFIWPYSQVLRWSLQSVEIEHVREVLLSVQWKTQWPATALIRGTLELPVTKKCLPTPYSSLGLMLCW